MSPIGIPIAKPRIPNTLVTKPIFVLFFSSMKTQENRRENEEWKKESSMEGKEREEKEAGPKL